MVAEQPTPAERRKGNLIAVVGTTGVGKSQLAIELALAVPSLATTATTRGGEIINSDSMQVYAGLDVITNKATPDEMKGVPHHLMGFLEPGEEYKVGDFQRDALAKIEELHDKETLPIVVGGTTYYVQHLIFPNQLVSDAPPPPLATPNPAPTPTPTPALSPSSPPLPKSTSDISHFPEPLKSRILALPSELLELFLLHPSLPPTSSPSVFPPAFPIQSLPSSLQEPESFAAALYSTLQKIDEGSAARWHWRDIRKVRRALDIAWEGRLWQDVLDAQAKNKDEGSRFRTLVFWLYAEPEVLNARLDARVDKMLELGLLEEIESLWSTPAKDADGNEVPVDYTRGVYQSIGYKEFEPFLSQRAALSPDADASTPPDKLFLEGLERMKLSTRQYAKKQVKWVKQNLVPAARAVSTNDVFVYLLDATDLAKWDETVRAPAVDILKAFLAEDDLMEPTSLSALAAKHLATQEAKAAGITKRACESCTEDPARPFLVEERGWEAHLTSKGHLGRRRKAQRLIDGPPYGPRRKNIE
ncbi:hypothetical protein RQP46_004480 [Phenoliferia psychrophenolica]